MEIAYTSLIQIYKLFSNSSNTVASLSMVLLFLLPLTFSGNTVPSEAQGATCSKSSIPTANVAANGNDGNIPQNTIDNNLNTRWSKLGLPAVIQYDLGASKTICHIDIAWYRGNLRVNTFTIYVSNDKVTFQNIFNGKSSGLTSSFERYNVPDTNARYVRVYITGNTENNNGSISEFKINSGTAISPPPSGVDKFGIKKIYPTKSGGEEWFMDMTDGQDSRSNPPSMTKNSDGSFKVTSTQVRYGAYTSSGYDPSKITTLNQAQLVQQGYMQSPNDWKNVELTGYVKVNSGQSGENFAWYARGGRHTGDGSPEGCEGTAYKPDLYYDGRVRFAKEQWHVSYVFTSHKVAMDSIEDKWVGFKGIMWNTIQNGKTVVKMEIWLDKNNDKNWVKVDERTDSGGWGTQGGECGGQSDQIMTWGGPIATFRWDGATDVDIKNFSVREIQPPS